MSERVLDLEGRDVTGCAYCVAFQFRDWQTVAQMQDSGKGCTCEDEKDFSPYDLDLP